MNLAINKMIIEIESVEKDLIIEAFKLPNITSPNSPVGDESNNKVIYKNYENEESLIKKYEK